jgi:hypothetical protein
MTFADEAYRSATSDINQNSQADVVLRLSRDVADLKIRVEALTRVLGIVGANRSTMPSKMMDKAIEAADSDIRQDLLKKHSHKGPFDRISGGST